MAKTSLKQVLDRHPDVFEETLGKLQGTTAKIYIEKNATPRVEKVRPVPFAIRHKVEQELERLQALGIIQPIQFTDWASPIVPVMKPDGSVRICGDFKVTINRVTKIERYPIPRIEELFASLAGGRQFSKLDLSHAYLQIPLDNASRRLVTITTHKGLFEYTRLPFGIASAPSIFQRIMENFLQGIPRVCVYLDDILVSGATEQEHLANLEQVLQRIESAGMKLKRPKCAFLLDSVAYLGHEISAEGLHTAKTKVKAIVDAPDPRNLTELRSFLARAIPTMASGRIQRWALLLSAYDYTIHYKQGKTNANADALSRLPLPSEVTETPIPAEVIHLMEHLDATPLSCSQVRRWTDQDLTLSKVKRCVLEGWPDRPDCKEDLSPYVQRRLELGVEEGCVLWGCRVVVPQKGRERALEMLHEAHPGMARMKALARSYMWWPGMDKEIERYVKGCQDCQSTRKDPPPLPLHPWSLPGKPWSRIHIDYAGPMEGRMFLLIVDAHSRWLEVHCTTSATSMTIELLRKSFATMGLPEVLVSDNATAFTSSEFTEILKRNGIHHVRTPPYHPASNRLVERAVQTFKEGFKRLREGSISTRISRFLFKYRLTPHSSTGVSPAELMFGRQLRSQLDQLRPSLEKTARQSQDRQKKNHDKRSRSRVFTQNQPVYARNYGPGEKWLPGVVVKLEGSVLVHVRLTDGRIVRRHLDQLHPREGKSEESSQTKGDDDVAEIGYDAVGTRNSESTTSNPNTSTSIEPPPPESEHVSESAIAEGLCTNDNITSGSQESVSESANAEGLSQRVEPDTGSREPRSGRTKKPPQRYEGQFS